MWLLLTEMSAEAKAKAVPVEKIPPELRIVDIGPQTISNFSEELRRCKTVFWNGPMGVYEIPQFAAGNASHGQAFSQS